MDVDSLGPLLDEIAPSSLAESWEHVGWQVRIPGQPLSGILLSVDVTAGVVAEAATSGCNLVFAHHPLFFRPLDSLDISSPHGSTIGALVRNGISLWAAHTNLDVLPWGTSYSMAEALGLKGITLLSAVDRQDYKLVIYVPASHAEEVKNAVAAAGAGGIGRYSHCFWEVLGTGQFKPEAGSSPYLGQVGEIERVEEYRVEGVVPKFRLSAVLAAMREAHPYEEIAYDLLPLANRVSGFGFGAVGSLDAPVSTSDFGRDAADRLSSAVFQVAGDPDRTHQRVAVVGGSGGSFARDARRKGATLFITADVRYHDAQEIVAAGLDLIILDHFATERPVLEAVRERLEHKLPGVPLKTASTATTPYVRVRT